MVIPWSPWGIGYLETTHPSAATARDNGAIDGWMKFSEGKTPPGGSIHPRFSLAARGCDLLQSEVFPMMTISSRAAATAFASLLLMSSAFAQATAPATAPATKMAPAEKKAEKPRTAASLECSKEADTKGVHGKERKKFMSECKKGTADKAK
jgi:psiF repeat